MITKADYGRLLTYQAQHEYYDKIVTRYMKFCADHSKDLDAAFASLPTSASNDATSNPPAALPSSTRSPANKGVPPPSSELSTLLLSLRKLREATLATASRTPIEFIQRVHIFSIRLSIRAQHPPSYFPSLRYSLDKLHSRSHPLPDSELKDIVSYLILDYACRQDDMVSAFELRARARKDYGFSDKKVDQALGALMHDNWIVFWRVRKTVDSYTQAVMDWAVDRVRRHALKAVGSAYLNAHVSWIVGGCTGHDESWTWEKLVDVEKLGWEKEGEKIVIRRPKTRAPAKPEPVQPSTAGS